MLQSRIAGSLEKVFEEEGHSGRLMGCLNRKLNIRLLSLIKEDSQLWAPSWLTVSDQVLQLASGNLLVSVSVSLDTRDRTSNPLDYQVALWLFTTLEFPCCKVNAVTVPTS